MFNRQKKIIALLLVIGLIGISFGIAPKTSFASNKYSRGERLELLRSNAYYVVSVIPGNSKGINLKNKAEVRKDNEMSEDYYLALSDKEFEKELRESIMSVIRRQSKGEKIIWSKPFLEKKLKSLFPDLYSEIVRMNKDEVHGIVRTDPIFTPGGDTRTFFVGLYTTVGTLVWDFGSGAAWTWDSYKITSVTCGYTAAVYWPWWGIWEYDGVQSEYFFYYQNHTAYYHYAKGKFVKNAFQVPIETDYPYIVFQIFAGGGYNYWVGIDTQ